MRATILTFAAVLATFSVFSQDIIKTSPARLQVYALKQDGSQAVMTSETMIVLYDQMKIAGELIFSTLNTDDPLLRNLLDSLSFDRITFSATFQEGQFVFRDITDTRFPAEAELIYGDKQCKIMLEYLVSNRNTSLANTFAITCTGKLSLKDDLGIERETGLDDRIAFQYTQNLQVKNY